MIAQLTGIVVSTGVNSAVIDVGGIGFLVACSHNTLSDISGKGGEKIKIYTHMVVREDAMELYGFSTQDELSAFRMLISVSGVGAKSAIAVLSTLSPEKFALAVTTEDAKAISKAPGVGARTAARIILELKDKIAKEFGGEAVSSAMTQEQIKGDDTLSDAVNTLIVLGYSRAEALSALSGLGGMNLEDMIKSALKKLSAMV